VRTTTDVMSATPVSLGPVYCGAAGEGPPCVPG
jgi:hypothetical protein